MGADYSFYVKIIETHVRTFLALNILAIGRVVWTRKGMQIVHETTLLAIKVHTTKIKNMI